MIAGGVANLVRMPKRNEPKLSDKELENDVRVQVFSAPPHENARSPRGRTPPASKRRLPYLAAMATALAFAFLSLIVIGISPMP